MVDLPYVKVYHMYCNSCCSYCDVALCVIKESLLFTCIFDVVCICDTTFIILSNLNADFFKRFKDYAVFFCLFFVQDVDTFHWLFIVLASHCPNKVNLGCQIQNKLQNG